MPTPIILAGALVAGIAVVKTFSGPWLPRRSGPENGWINEAYAAREEAQSWAENELSVGNGPDTAPPRII